MVFISINTSSGVPIYRQIVDQVKVAIGTETLGPGERLPSVRALSELLVVNPTTVQRAYLDLEREGVIETRRGQGTFVKTYGLPLPQAERERRVGELLRPALAEASRLQLDHRALRRLFEQQLEEISGTTSTPAGDGGGPTETSDGT